MTKVAWVVAVDEAVRRSSASWPRPASSTTRTSWFTSDNGFFHGERRVPNGKYLPYEVSSQLVLDDRDRGRHDHGNPRGPLGFRCR
jgi:hypothetical protein